MRHVKSVIAVILCIASLAVFDSTELSAQLFRGRIFNRCHQHQFTDPCCNPCVDEPVPNTCTGMCDIEEIDGIYVIVDDGCEVNCMCQIPELREAVPVSCVNTISNGDLIINGMPTLYLTRKTSGHSPTRVPGRHPELGNGFSIEKGELTIHIMKTGNADLPCTVLPPRITGEVYADLSFYLPGRGNTSVLCNSLKVPRDGSRTLLVKNWRITAWHNAFEQIQSALYDDVDCTTEFSSDATNIQLFERNNSEVIIGSSEKFSTITFDLETEASQGIEPTIKFWDGMEWATLDRMRDGTKGMTKSGVIRWNRNSVQSWEKQDGRYRIQILRTAVDVTTPPRENKVLIQQE